MPEMLSGRVKTLHPSVHAGIDDEDEYLTLTQATNLLCRHIGT